MNDMFDINLLSQIQALDRKLSVANERPRLKRKTTDDHKEKSSRFYENRTIKTVAKDGERTLLDETETLHVNIDITV